MRIGIQKGAPGKDTLSSSQSDSGTIHALFEEKLHPLTNPNYKAAVGIIIKAATDGKPQHEAVLTVGHTPALLIAQGLPDLPLVITGKTIDKVYFDHAITKGVIERLHDLVAAPSAIYKSAPPHANGNVVITIELHRGNPVIIPIRSSRQFGRTLVANEITSVYAKEGGDFENRWKADGLLLWTNKINNP